MCPATEPLHSPNPAREEVSSAEFRAQPNAFRMARNEARPGVPPSLQLHPLHQALEEVLLHEVGHAREHLLQAPVVGAARARHAACVRLLCLCVS